MIDAPELRLYLASTADFGSPSCCHDFIRLLSELSEEWLPEHFGSAEPLRQRFRQNNLDEVCTAWMAQPRPGSHGGDLLFQTSSKLAARGWVYWRRGPRHDVNFINVAIESTKATAEIKEQLVKLGTGLISGLGGVYGRVCHSIDFELQHKFTTESGFRFVGQRLSEGIPGIYWANLFSRELVELIGEERLLRCPSTRADTTDDGTWVLYSSVSPEDFASAETRALRKAMRAALGEELFFSIERPLEKPLSLPIDRSRIVS